VWDARKSDRNLRERGFDFEFATQIFDSPTLERTDARRDYGEQRVIALGRAQGIPLTASIPIGLGPLATSIDESFQPARVTAVSVKPTKKPSRSSRVLRGRADLAKLRRMSDSTIRATSPSELAELPDDFWAEASVVEPTTKKPISLRVDADVLDWFKTQGPRYQSRINAVLRSYMTQRRQSSRRAG
jgi:uncharacterized protein (DUF4415 family)